MDNKSNSILTIAIPTYNRSRSLGRLLQQLRKEKWDFKILVSDNNSSDNTEKIVGGFQKFMLNLIYNKNKTNLGYSGNILKLYELAKTRYIWFLSDDEEVLPGAVGKVLKSLSANKPIVALFNHIRIDPYGRKLEDGVFKDVCYKNINEVKDYSSILRACFLSIVIIKKLLSVDRVKEICKDENLYPQLSLSLLLLDKKFKFCQFAFPTVSRQATYESGEFFKFLLTGWLDAIFIVKAKFDNKKFIWLAKKEIFNNLQIYLAQKIGMYKYNGKPTIDTMRKIIKYYGVSSMLILFFFIIYHLTPTFLLKYLYRRKLVEINGEKAGLKIYNMNLDRVYGVTRNSGFINYR